MTGGIYIHIPFCIKKCDYCSFYSESVGENPSSGIVSQYIEQLIREISSESINAKNINFDTIFFGGGTPTFINPEEIKTIIDRVRDNYAILENPEISIEMNPLHFSKERMKEYIDVGVNRFSLGVQTIDKDAYGTIGRRGGFCDEHLINEYSSFKNVSLGVDLIAGIPCQNSPSFYEGLSILSSGNIRHFSVYLLTLEPGTPLYEKRGDFSDCEEHEQKQVFSKAVEFLESKGFNQYEVSNFAVKGFESKHNLKYWTWQPYLGFGPSAHSFLDNKRYSNPANLKRYLSGFERIDDKRNIEKQMAEFIMTGLRLLQGFSTKRFQEAFEGDIPNAVMEDILKQEKADNIYVERDESGKASSVKIKRARIFFIDTITFEIIKSLI